MRGEYLFAFLLLSPGTLCAQHPPTAHKPPARKIAAPVPNLSQGFVAVASRAKEAIAKDNSTTKIDALTAASDRIDEAETAAGSAEEKAFVEALREFRTLSITTNVMVKIKRITYELQVEDTVVGRRAPEFEKEVTDRIETDRDVAKFRITSGDCGDALNRILNTRVWSGWPADCPERKAAK